MSVLSAISPFVSLCLQIGAVAYPDCDEADGLSHAQAASMFCSELGLSQHYER